MQKIIIYSLSFLITAILFQPISYGQDQVSDSGIYDYPSTRYFETFDFNDFAFSHRRINKLTQNLERRSSFKMRLDSIYGWRLISGTFTHTGKTEFIYDEDNLKEIKLFFGFDNEIEEIVPKTFGVLHYNKNDLLIKETFNLWDGDYNNLNDDLPLSMREFTYDTNNNLILYEYQNYEDIITNRVLNQISYTYDEANNLIKSTWNRWNNSVDSLAIFKETTYSYDANENLKEEIRWKQHVTRGWEKTDSIIFNYYDDNKLESRTQYAQIFNLSLDPLRMDIYNYSINNLLLSSVEYELFDLDSGEWWDIDIIEYEYDNFNNLIFSATYDSTQLKFDRELVNENIYFHNNDIFTEDVQLPRRNIWNFNSFLLDNSLVQPLLKYENYSGGGIDPQFLSNREEYFYSDIETSTLDIDFNNEKLKFRISPNPTADYITLEVDANSKLLDIFILDIQGQLVFKTKVRPNEILDVSQLVQGIYFCKAKIGKYDIVEKFIKF